MQVWYYRRPRPTPSNANINKVSREIIKRSWRKVSFLPPLLFTSKNSVLHIGVHRHLVVATFHTVPSPGRHLARISASLLVADCCKHLDAGVQQVEQNSHDGIRSNVALFRVRELEAQTPVDSAENQQNTSPPEMGVAENATASSLGKPAVVQLAQNRLDSKQADHDGAKQSMVVVKELGSSQQESSRFLQLTKCGVGRKKSIQGYLLKPYQFAHLCAIHPETKERPHAQPSEDLEPSVELPLTEHRHQRRSKRVEYRKDEGHA